MRVSRTAEDPEFTEEEVNHILEEHYHWSRHTGNKKSLDVFNLHMVLFVGNSEDSEWNLNKNYMMFNEHSIGISIGQFWGCCDAEDVIAAYSEAISDRIKEEV